MGKQKGGSNVDKVKATSKTTASASNSSVQDDVRFPAIGGQKHARTLESPQVLVADQVLLYPNTLTNSECESLIGMFDSDNLKMQASPPAKKGEAERTNFRFSTVSPKFAKELYESTGLSKVVADWPSVFPKMNAKPVGLSSNIRIYRYDPGAIFACHYDDHSIDPHFGPSWGKTEWTLLVYLTGEPEVQGGQTVFYKGHTRPKDGIQSENAIVAPLMKGAALLHRHGKACMLHEALPPTKGTKWVLRSDLVFGTS
ncbi:uncharacterized protein FA14DRAFT_4964 [Meira miltonrushii]|uniref:Fe2OG dioxygenase domain-containing protein n=1 Tax=Meira miltonrushii TaxID=1280837 RepID=A0A316VG77_9BASI|nr:uncharacterized protein FA14DRAFT_4964 [Meira miltonrushii]PWN36637.1 hypothetical protein FA14DRAFT_4964 [Meira miltonrushii]